MWKWKKKHRNPLKDYYAILGVSQGASQKVITVAFRKQALDCHPDRNSSPEAKARFQELVAAYQVLKSPDKRNQFDARIISEFCTSFAGSFSPEDKKKKKRPLPEIYRILRK